MPHADRIERPLAIHLLAVVILLIGASVAQAYSTRTLFTPTGSGSEYFGYPVASAGDFNGDGYPDVIVGSSGNHALLYWGGPTADATADLTLNGFAGGDQFGIAVASAGDVNGDGYTDVIVGAPFAPNGAGAGLAYVYFGGATPDATPDLTLSGNITGDLFGRAVSGVGDINGDGYADFIVGAPANDAGGADAGRAYVYLGGPSPDAVADLTITGSAANQNLGMAVASAGDVNGDHYGDFIVGGPGAGAGMANVYFGAPSPDATPDLTLTGTETNELFGTAVAAGDVNGDGFSDLIVGAYEYDYLIVDEGRFLVYLGGPGADATPDLEVDGAHPNDWLGISLSAGDINRDGYCDIIAGAPETPNFGSGAAYVFFGSSGLNGVPDITLEGSVAGDYFGYSVAAVGDVDGDGFGDLAIGAPFGGGSAGRAYVTACYPYQVVSPNGGEQWVSGRPATVRWRGHDSADLAISVDGGASWSTLLSGVGGKEDNEQAVVAPALPSSGARIRLSVSGQPVSRATSDISDGVFSIVAPIASRAAAHRLQLAPTGAAASDNFAGSVAGAGDVNGDGYADWIVGANANDAGGSNAGRAYVYYGGPGADAVADLTFTGAAANDNLGVSVAGAGDVNGDGYADLIVGASGSNSTGRAYVYYGGPGADAIPDLTLNGAAASDNFGFSVAGAGDVNGDGFADVIVGANRNDAAATDAGRAYVFFGGYAPDATADLILTGAAATDFFGYSVAGAGDVNGDGYADVIVGAFHNDAAGSDAGRAYVYYGGRTPNAVADLLLTGAAAGDNFGYSVAGAGDFNGDGFADVIVGAYLNDALGTNTGRAYIYYGGLGADATPDLVLNGATAGDGFGFSVAGVGDANGDGFADVAVSGLLSDANGTDAGRAYLYYGGPGADAVADQAFTGAAAGDVFGWSLAGAGDTNADGFADLVVGANSNDVGGNNAGRAYLYDCNRYFVLSPNDDEVWNVGASQSISWLGAERADLWLSVDAGRSYDLLRHDVGGGETNTLTLLAPHAPTKFARIKVTPANSTIRGADESDSTFTIQSSVALLNFAVTPTDGGAELSWSTEPGVGPGGLAGYRLYRSRAGEAGNGTRVGPELITESRYADGGGVPGTSYRLVAVNGLMEELELGRVDLAPAAPLAAWPMPYRGGLLSCSFGVNGEFGSTLGDAVVELYDLSGRLVRTLARGRFQAGYRTVRWDGRDQSGTPVRSGIYFLSARSGGASHQLKLVVTR
jgi:hypothetical protein